VAIFVKYSAAHILRSIRELPAEHAYTKELLPARSS